MALPKSFKPLGPNFTPGDPREALAHEIVGALKENAGIWHVAKSFRKQVDAVSFGELLEHTGAARVEVDVKGCVVRARHLPTTSSHETMTQASVPGDIFAAPRAVVPPAVDDAEVIDTSESRGRGRAR